MHIHNTLAEIDLIKDLQNIMNIVQDFFASIGMVGNLILALIVFWVGKSIAVKIGKLIEKGLNKTTIDDKIAEKLGHRTGVAKGIAGFAVALMILMVLLFAVGVAKIDTDIASPIRELLDVVMGYIPRVLVAGILTYIVVKLAGLVKTLVAGALNAARVDERLGAVAGTSPISGALSIAVYSLILLLFTPAILDALKIDAVSAPIGEIVDTILSSVPNILLAGILLAIGVVIARIASRLIVNLMEASNLNAFPAKLGLEIPEEGPRSLSGIVGFLVYLSIMVVLATAAINQLEIDLLSKASEGFLSGYYNVLLAAIILLGGILASKFVYGKLVEQNATLAKVARAAIIILTSVVALERTELAAGLTSLPYEIALYAAGFSIGVGGAIAIGLGGKEFVSRWLSKKG